MTKLYHGFGFLLTSLVLVPLTGLNAQEPPPSPPGYLVISLGPVLNIAPVSLFLDYASDDKELDIDNEAEWVSLSVVPNDYDLKNGDRGVVYVRSIPPGKYHFYRIAENDGYFVYWWRFSIPFTISPGHVTYVGDFKFVAQQARGFLGMPVQKGGYLVVSNESARDIPIASQKVKAPSLVDLPIDVLSVERDILNAPPFCMSEQPDVLTPGTDVPLCPVPEPKQ